MVSLLFLNGQETTSGCAPAPPDGFDVKIRDEFALIVWDPDTKLEHFIRVANFETKAPDIGFLVPTPSVPELTEVNAAGISRVLAQQTKPRVVTKTEVVTEFGLGPWPHWDNRVGATLDRGAPVEVLAEYDVAGYDASVLRAEDPVALREWLDQRKYVTSDALQDWLQIYTDQKWIITAFKLSKNGPSPKLVSKAVRMSFHSERPFYPYREPASKEPDPNAGSRFLRVFLLSDIRYEGRIGSQKAWPARTVWSGTIDDYYKRQLATSARFDMSAMPNRLTEYEDHSFPRLGVDELYFSKASTQATVERPVKTRVVTQKKHFPGWGGAILFAIVTPLVILSGAGLWMFRRRKTESPNAKTDKPDKES